jgi:hypothetical protein
MWNLLGPTPLVFFFFLLFLFGHVDPKLASLDFLVNVLPEYSQLELHVIFPCTTEHLRLHSRVLAVVNVGIQPCLRRRTFPTRLS